MHYCNNCGHYEPISHNTTIYESIYLILIPENHVFELGVQT